LTELGWGTAREELRLLPGFGRCTIYRHPGQLIYLIGLQGFGLNLTGLPCCGRSLAPRGVLRRFQRLSSEGALLKFPPGLGGLGWPGQLENLIWKFGLGDREMHA